MKAQTILSDKIICSLLVLMWSYAALVKMLDIDLARSQMRNQIFPLWMAYWLSYLVPVTELICALLLLTPITKKIGLWLSCILLFMFTLYIIAVKSLIFGRVPCSCGGVISGLSWMQHLLFNLFFLGLSIYGLIIHQKERRWRGTAA